MNRFIDRILSNVNPPTWEENKKTHQQKIRAWLSDAQVYNINNVAEHFYQRIGGEAFIHTILKEWNIFDFPCLTPPHPKVFFEFCLPQFMCERAATYEKSLGTTYSNLFPYPLKKLPIPTERGVILCSFTEDEAREYIAQWNITSDIVPTDFRWAIWVYFFCGYPTFCSGPVSAWLIFLDAQGRICKVGRQNDDAEWIPLFHTDGKISYPLGSQQSQSLSYTRMTSTVYPVFLALSFLHCKNVQTKEHLPNKKESAYHRRIHGVPLTKYYTLEIDPMKKILREEGQSETLGLKKALHICRGHFSEYGPEFGKGKLFGKLEGRYWIPQHVKGSAEQGIINKDYAIKAPE